MVPHPDQVDPALLEKLKALGYVHRRTAARSKRSERAALGWSGRCPHTPPWFAARDGRRL